MGLLVRSLSHSVMEYATPTLHLQATAATDVLVSAYVYGNKTFVTEMPGMKIFILALIFFGGALGVVSVIGFYAVRYEHGLYLKLVKCQL